MKIQSSVRDLTDRQCFGGVGMPIVPQWLCGHRSVTGKKRAVPGLQPVMWMCSACVAKKAKA